MDTRYPLSALLRLALTLPPGSAEEEDGEENAGLPPAYIYIVNPYKSNVAAKDIIRRLKEKVCFARSLLSLFNFPVRRSPIETITSLGRKQWPTQ